MVSLTPHIPSDTSFSRKLRGASRYVSIVYCVCLKETNCSPPPKKNMLGFKLFNLTTAWQAAFFFRTFLFCVAGFFFLRRCSFVEGPQTNPPTPQAQWPFRLPPQKKRGVHGFSYGWFMRIWFIQWWILKIHRCFGTPPFQTKSWSSFWLSSYHSCWLFVGSGPTFLPKTLQEVSTETIS